MKKKGKIQIVVGSREYLYFPKKRHLSPVANQRRELTAGETGEFRVKMEELSMGISFKRVTELNLRVNNVDFVVNILDKS